MYERVFVLEVSGPTLELLRERVDHLPNFRRFLQQGAWSRLRSPIQPVLPPAFATLLTGKNPGKTGLFDFFKLPAGGYRRIPYSTELLTQEPFYQLLSRRGVRVGLLNVPLTYPLPRVNGFVVSGDEGIAFLATRKVPARADAEIARKPLRSIRPRIFPLPSSLFMDPLL